MRSCSMAVKRAMSLLVVFIGVLVFSVVFARTDVYAASQSKGIVTVSSLNIRSGPGTDKSVVGVIRKNDSVKIISTKDGWYKINVGKDKSGWVSAQFVRKSSDNDDIQTVKKTSAKKSASSASSAKNTKKIIQIKTTQPLL